MLERLVAPAGKDVVDVGCGGGALVRDLVALGARPIGIEISEEQLATARARDGDSGARYLVGRAEALPLDDGSADVVVFMRSLHHVPPQHLEAGLREARRVLRPGGELRFYEHVVSRGRGGALLQRLADATVWPHLAGGCHMSRDTLSEIEAAGFTVESCERFTFSPGAPVPPIPHILGIARRG